MEPRERVIMTIHTDNGATLESSQLVALLGNYIHQKRLG